MATFYDLIEQIENPKLRESVRKEVAEMEKHHKIDVSEDHLLALVKDYLNVFVVRPNEDSADIVKLEGYETTGIKSNPQGFSYTKLLNKYIDERVFENDKDRLRNTLSVEQLIKTFADGKDNVEYNYRVKDEKGEMHEYAARYGRISNPNEELKLVVAFRNIDYVYDLGAKKDEEGRLFAYNAISEIFFSLHRVDVKNNTYTAIKSTQTINAFSDSETDNYDLNAKRVINLISSELSRKDALKFVDRKTLDERLAGKNHIYMDFVSYASELCKLHFFVEDLDENGKLNHVIFAVERANDQQSQAIIDVLSRDYQNMFLIDLDKGSARVLKLEGFVSNKVNNNKNAIFDYATTCDEYIAERVHPDDKEAFLKEVSLDNLREKFKSGKELAGSFRVLTNEGEHHYRYTFYKLDGQNSIVAGYRNVDDIIAKHEAEKRLQRQKEETYQNQIDEQLQVLQLLAKNFKNVYMVNFETETARFLKLDENYKDILDITNEEFPFDVVRSNWINNIVCEDDREELTKTFETENVKKMLAENEAFSGNYRSIVNGQTHYYQYTMRAIGNDGKKAVLGFQNIDKIVEEHFEQDRKERELNEKRLKAEREHTEVISSISTIYSTIFRAYVDTHEYDILSSVDLMKKTVLMHGNFDDVKEKILTAFMAPEMRAPMREFLDLNTIAKRLEKTHTVLTEYKDNDGRWFQARFVVKRRDEKGVVKEVLYVAREISADKARELEHQDRLSHALAAAQQASKAKSTFLNSMSHDIRTPMNAIIGFTALAQTHIDDKAQVQDYLGKISTSSNHLLSLINDILDMSRIESGTVKLDERPLHIPDLLHDLRAMVLGLVNSKNLNLYIDTQDVIHEDVIADKLRLNQIMLNIVGNAVKFTKPGGDVIIRLVEKPSARKHYRNYEFSVKDTGVGMSKEFVSHVFESFTRERSSTVSGVQGTGLGMAITKNIVDMMGGEITAESELGKGSLFTVKLSMRLANEPVKTEPIPDLLGARALVVDDDIDTCRSISKMLRDIQMRPDWTASGKEAIVRAQDAAEMKDEYKVYIIDYLMPDMNGIETVRRIRKVISEEVPIIVLTAYDWADFEVEAREAGVTAFVSKPLFMSELRQVLTKTNEKENTKVQEKEHYDYGGKHVLLVEDNELNREIATALLEEMNIIVDCATDGTEAVDIMYKANEDKYDLILMDIQMPKMNGYTATHEIRTLANNRKANIPIVAMTANAFEEDRQKSIEAGMNGHITKPISFKEVAKVLDKVFLGK